MNRTTTIMLVVFTLLLLIDLYAFKGTMHLLHGTSWQRFRVFVPWIYWAVSALFFLLILLAFTTSPGSREPHRMSRFFLLGGIMLAVYIPKLLLAGFHLTEDVLKLTALGMHKIAGLFFRKAEFPDPVAEQISRFRFITQLGLVLAAVPFVSLIWGMVFGRFRFSVVQQELEFRNLPPSFGGLKIVQISDIHIGSFYGHEEKVKEAIEMVNSQNPDLIVFTGDLVNDHARELEGWMDILGGMKARLGKFAILGNHDYGDYYQWESVEAKNANHQKIIGAFGALGFRLLLNESVRIERNGEHIGLIGVENWGNPPFAQYGDFEKARMGTADNPFKILLSHDPTHWDAEIMEKTDVDLTLSGHTHGMQFGIETKNIKWSPVQWKYPRWAGLYREGNQYLYVNRGLGYIGYPGRVGIPPEITVITLHSA